MQNISDIIENTCQIFFNETNHEYLPADRRGQHYQSTFGSGLYAMAKRAIKNNTVPYQWMTTMGLALHISFDIIFFGKKIDCTLPDVFDSYERLNLAAPMLRQTLGISRASKSRADKSAPPLRWFYIVAETNNVSLDWLFRGLSGNSSIQTSSKPNCYLESIDIEIASRYKITYPRLHFTKEVEFQREQSILNSLLRHRLELAQNMPDTHLSYIEPARCCMHAF